MDLNAIHDPTLICALETSCLDPGIREVPLAVPAEEEDPTNGRYLPSLLIGYKAQRLEVAAVEITYAGEQLRCSSEVQGFRVVSGVNAGRCFAAMLLEDSKGHAIHSKSRSSVSGQREPMLIRR